MLCVSPLSFHPPPPCSPLFPPLPHRLCSLLARHRHPRRQVAPVREYLTHSSEAASVVLDGEILLVDNATGRPLPFGTLNKHKKTEFKDASVCVYVFDILFLNGESLLGMKITERRRLLTEVRALPGGVPARK